MADTAALDGIGAALSAFGQVYGDYKKEGRDDKREIDKQKLLEKLRRESVIDAEQREALRYDSTKIEEGDVPGVFWSVKYNKSGDPMSRERANESAIRGIKAARERDKLGLDKLLIDNKTAQMELDSLSGDIALDRRYKESQIDLNQDTGLAAIMRARDSGGSGGKPDKAYTPSASEVSNALLEDYATVIEERGYSATEARQLANAVALELINRAKNGNPSDPGKTFLAALQMHKQGK